MTWRPTQPQSFFPAPGKLEVLPVLQLEHLGSDSQPDGWIAKVYLENDYLGEECYTLRVIQNNNFIRYDTPIPWAILQALKELPHPERAESVGTMGEQPDLMQQAIALCDIPVNGEKALPLEEHAKVIKEMIQALMKRIINDGNFSSNTMWFLLSAIRDLEFVEQGIASPTYLEIPKLSEEQMRSIRQANQFGRIEPWNSSQGLY